MDLYETNHYKKKKKRERSFLFTISVESLATINIKVHPTF